MGTAYDSSTLWLFNTAMENGPFIDGLPTKNCGSFHGYVKKPDGICKWLAAQGMAGCVLWFCVSEFSVRPQMTDRLWLQNLVSTKRQKSNWPCLYTYIYIAETSPVWGAQMILSHAPSHFLHILVGKYVQRTTGYPALLVLFRLWFF